MTDGSKSPKLFATIATTLVAVYILCTIVVSAPYVFAVVRENHSATYPVSCESSADAEAKGRLIRRLTVRPRSAYFRPYQVDFKDCWIEQSAVSSRPVWYKGRIGTRIPAAELHVYFDEVTEDSPVPLDSATMTKEEVYIASQPDNSENTAYPIRNYSSYSASVDYDEGVVLADTLALYLTNLRRPPTAIRIQLLPANH